MLYQFSVKMCKSFLRQFSSVVIYTFVHVFIINAIVILDFNIWKSVLFRFLAFDVISEMISKMCRESENLIN